MSNDDQPLARSRQCMAPELNRLLTSFCFGHASEREQAQVRAHLLECDVCWEEAQRLESAVRVLRSDRSLAQSLTPRDVATAFGISSKLELPFGGHLWHALAACGLYAALYAVALVVEIAYQFDRYSHSAIPSAVVAFIWIWGTSIAGLAADWKLTERSSARGWLCSFAIFLISALILFAGASFYLPKTPVTEMTMQAMTAPAAYLKTITYFLVLKSLFLLPPFHFVLAAQRELQAGRHQMILNLLAGDKLSVTPRGSIYLRTWFLIGLLIVMACIAMFLPFNLVNNLRQAPYMNLFTNLLQTRLMLYFALGLECVAWYARTLNEIKRECVAAERNWFNARK
ncbi:MAG: hypothetical protein ACREEM_19190 [Blastocatellia bacterium]